MQTVRWNSMAPSSNVIVDQQFDATVVDFSTEHGAEKPSHRKVSVDELLKFFVSINPFGVRVPRLP